MYFKFSNSSGSLVFGSQHRSDSMFRITDITGLSISDKSFATAVYANLRGQETVGTRVCPRTITISGDVIDSEISLNALSEAAFILDKPGTLEIHFDDKNPRKIDCVCTSFIPGETKGRYKLFVIQFMCDDPYFYDDNEINCPAFGVRGYLNSSFKFPGLFSTRISNSTIFCKGNALTEPTFKIAVMKKNESANPTLCIKNHTTGSSINLKYSATVGDVITIDTSKRKIYNQRGENLLWYLADDSFFSDFYLVPGNNNLSIDVSGTIDAVRVDCLYCARYIEAVL